MLLRLLAVSGAVLAAAAPTFSNGGNATNPVVDLGAAGSYMGIIQNNGTVASWKGIPYAQPPLGDLRFMPPKALAAQNSSVVDVTVDALRCVQFTGAAYGVINGDIVGPRAGPGQEDCLKMWIWKPANVSAGANLPVMYYIHGGALQYSAAPNNDFSDWVGQSQDFIAVNVAYRLGALGFMAHPSLPSANAGLLDQRFGLQWVKQNIAAFGGNPNDITVMGQSGGGLAAAAQLVLYDGDTQGLFQKAIARSIQRSPTFHVSELADRNAAYFSALNCTAGQDQLDCFRNASVPAIVDAYATLSDYKAASGPFQNSTFGQMGAFLPMVDGVTLTDSITRLFKKGKVANVSVIAGTVNDEGAKFIPPTVDVLSPATNGLWNLTDEQVNEAATFYPVNDTFGYTSPDNFFLTGYKAYIQSLGPFGEAGMAGSERMVGKYVSNAHGSNGVWTFRFNAPGVGLIPRGAKYPLNYVAHSADNTYLQNATSVMTPFEKAMAYEWRAYMSSFIRTGDPNTQKLATAPYWHNYGFLGDYDNSPVRLVPQFAFSSNANSSFPTSTQLEVSQKAQIEREEWWLSDALLDSIRL